jgi:hypothetical protein
MATAIALLILNFVDEHFNSGIYTDAAAKMILQIRRSWAS